MNCKVNCFYSSFLIDIEFYVFEDEEEQELQAPATPSGVDTNSLLAAMMEKMQEITDVRRGKKRTKCGGTRSF